MNLKGIIDLNIKHKTIQLLEKNKRKSSGPRARWRVFRHENKFKTWNAHSITEKLISWSSKLKTIALQDLIKRMKGQRTDWEKNLQAACLTKD